jgi:hypothetical protein
MLAYLTGIKVLKSLVVQVQMGGGRSALHAPHFHGRHCRPRRLMKAHGNAATVEMEMACKGSLETERIDSVLINTGSIQDCVISHIDSKATRRPTSVALSIAILPKSLARKARQAQNVLPCAPSASHALYAPRANKCIKPNSIAAQRQAGERNLTIYSRSLFRLLQVPQRVGSM